MRVNCALADCGSPREDFARHGGATLALLSFAMLIVSLDQYIVVVALPEIGRDLGYSPQTLQSVISAYAVAELRCGRRGRACRVGTGRQFWQRRTGR